ncbi:hypothetical protein C0Q44_01125 [Paenibacillus sp. PCH8]|uniref:hypothetical protein n=1 Tax=Paenibacillus sp. PCH8 TaxID=2066524 RepID=UPI000CF8ED74|nr:hypothetical protein [Paenibacillus sp. PCH8]PQP83352.1 hypothetical protein C0Q44_01125 [Paenibacillus sp. PCH8]
MSKNVLKLGDPVISTYTSYGTLTSIMNEELWPWIFNNFIQIRYAYDWGIFSFDSHQYLLGTCPGISFYNLPQEMVISKWGTSLKDVITEAIDMGYYLYIYADRYYIASTDYYQREHLMHEVLVYGYDLDRNLIYIADNLEDGKFVQVTCALDELEEGYWTMSDEYSFWTEVRFLKPIENINYGIYVDQIISGMENYLNSSETFNLIRDQEYDFGMQAIQRIFTEIENSALAGEALDSRVFHLLYEHKLLMELRLTYLMEKAYMEPDVSFVELSTQLKQDYFKLRNIVLKYNITRDARTLGKISERLQENLTKEKAFITSFILRLQRGKTRV